jgi:hypothetical protein
MGTWSYFIQYVQEFTHEPEKIAGYFLTGTLVAFGVGRFSSAWLMRFVAPRGSVGVWKHFKESGREGGGFEASQPSRLRKKCPGVQRSARWHRLSRHARTRRTPRKHVQLHFPGEASALRSSVTFYKGRSQGKTHLLRLKVSLLRSPLN